jgi:hypothetical protein
METRERGELKREVREAAGNRDGRRPVNAWAVLNDPPAAKTHQNAIADFVSPQAGSSLQ